MALMMFYLFLRSVEPFLSIFQKMVNFYAVYSRDRLNAIQIGIETINFAVISFVMEYMSNHLDK